MKTRQLSLLIFILFISINSFAQYFGEKEDLKGVYKIWEIGITAGANNFLGDVGGSEGVGNHFIKDYSLQTIKPLVGASVNFNMNYWSSLKFGFNFSSVEGADSLIKNSGGQERWRYNRNQSFHSNIFEVYAGVDVFPFMLLEQEREIHQLSPFIGAGVGLYHFNPKTKLNDEWVELQPLRLEGQGFTEYPDRQQYSLLQLYIPVTVGLKYFINNKIALSGGVNFRQTFTDYIDNLSTTYIDPALFDKYLQPDQAALAMQLYSRSKTPEKVRPDIEKANSENNDTYVTVFFSLSFRLNKRVVFYYGQ